MEHVLHGGHRRRVPAANICVERSCFPKHCASPAHAKSDTKCTAQTKRKVIRKLVKSLRGDSQEKMRKVSQNCHTARQEWGRLAVVVAHDLCSRNPSGDQRKGKERVREGGTHLVPYWSPTTCPNCQCPC
jgi:hypothetical protein